VIVRNNALARSRCGSVANTISSVKHLVNFNELHQALSMVNTSAENSN
jgi:hypothetical protein